MPGRSHALSGAVAGIALGSPRYGGTPAYVTYGDGGAGIRRAPTRRYLKLRFGCLRCSRRECFVCFYLRGGRIT